MGNDQNPYQAYTDGSIFSDSPLALVVALYQGALDATRQAEIAVEAKDIPARTKAVNKAIAIVTELLVSLDLERGGEIGQSLKRLYSYMQVQLLNGHIQQAAEPFVEVSRLLTTLLEGWRGAQMIASTQTSFELTPTKETPETYASATVYGGYWDDSLAASVSGTHSF